MVSKTAQKNDNLQAKLTIVFHKLAISINTRPPIGIPPVGIRARWHAPRSSQWVACDDDDDDDDWRYDNPKKITHYTDNNNGYKQTKAKLPGLDCNVKIYFSTLFTRFVNNWIFII